MKHLVAVLLGLVSLIGIYFFIQYSSQPQSFTVSTPSVAPSPSRVIVQNAKQSMLFVPYWGLGSKDLPGNYDQLIYFGIQPSSTGINTQEIGYTDLALFTRRAPSGSKKLLTIRMIDPEINSKLLKDKALQQTVISQVLQTAKQYGFTGIVLDFEYNALAFDSVIASITTLSTDLAKATHAQHMTFYQAVYGDTFYRLRPYDVGKLAKNADGIIVMAYDFHKANGDAGPNFPLSGKDTQGYDFKAMIDDFSQKISAQKIIVAFGLYGYDWELDGKGHSIAAATPLSLVQIQQKFLNICAFTSCKVIRDNISSETKITYTDGQEKHEVWFEDMQSVAQKSAYLHTQGINATALWAYSYF